MWWYDLLLVLSLIIFVVSIRYLDKLCRHEIEKIRAIGKEVK